jgi:hypothetical protein
MSSEVCLQRSPTFRIRLSLHVRTEKGRGEPASYLFMCEKAIQFKTVNTLLVKFAW